MQTLQFSVDDARCTRCGACALDCIATVIAQDGDALPHVIPERAQYCIQCQHCLAICPEGAVAVRGLRPEDSEPLPGDGLDPRKLETLIKGRRSVRRTSRQRQDQDQ